MFFNKPRVNVGFLEVGMRRETGEEVQVSTQPNNMVIFEFPLQSLQRTSPVFIPDHKFCNHGVIILTHFITASYTCFDTCAWVGRWCAQVVQFSSSRKKVTIRILSVDPRLKSVSVDFQ